MPTAWNRTPAEIHKIYVANTDAFYLLGGSPYKKELDEFISGCVRALWSKGTGITDRHVELANELYSRGTDAPKWMLWSLTEAVCKSEEFLPPVFFWSLAENDVKRGTELSRALIRTITNILLYCSAVDDDVTYREAEYITGVQDKMNAICDTIGVKNTRSAMNPMDYVTSEEPSFTEKHSNDKTENIPQTAVSGTAEKASAAQEPAEEEKNRI